MGGNLGMEIDLGRVPADQIDRNDVVLFSESPGRFIVTIDPENRKVFEDLFKGLDFACMGTVITSYSIHYTKLYEYGEKRQYLSAAKGAALPFSSLRHRL